MVPYRKGKLLQARAYSLLGNLCLGIPVCEISLSNLADLQKALLYMQRTEGHGSYSIRAESCTRLLRQTCRTWIKSAWESQRGVLRKAPTNCLLTDAEHIFSTLQGSVHIFFDLDELSVFIDSTYWYFLKAQAIGVLLRWLNELLVPRLARSHLSGTACIIIQSRRMRALSPKFLRLTSPGEQRSDDYIRPTFTPPRYAGSQLITHTNMHTQSHYRWIHIRVGLTQCREDDTTACRL